jgi:hypothetical protein
MLTSGSGCSQAARECQAPRDVVISACGSWPSTGAPTAGYAFHALRALGVEAGTMHRPTLLRMCRELGLDFAESAQGDTGGVTR